MDYDEILPGITVGSFPASGQDIDQLAQDLDVSAVLNVQTDADFRQWGVDWQQLEAHYRQLNMEVRRVPIRDFDVDDLQRKLPTAVAALDALLRARQTVYIHCSAGINRSPTVVIAYLHWVAQWPLHTAAAHVQSHRSCDPSLEVIEVATWRGGQPSPS